MYVKCVVNMLQPNLKSQKKDILFFILECRSWEFKPLLEDVNPTFMDRFLEPKSSDKKH